MSEGREQASRGVMATADLGLPTRAGSTGDGGSVERHTAPTHDHRGGTP